MHAFNFLMQTLSEAVWLAYSEPLLVKLLSRVSLSCSFELEITLVTFVSDLGDSRLHVLIRSCGRLLFRNHSAVHF